MQKSFANLYIKYLGAVCVCMHHPAHVKAVGNLRKLVLPFHIMSHMT